MTKERRDRKAVFDFLAAENGTALNDLERKILEVAQKLYYKQNLQSTVFRLLWDNRNQPVDFTIFANQLWGINFVTAQNRKNIMAHIHNLNSQLKGTLDLTYNPIQLVDLDHYMLCTVATTIPINSPDSPDSSEVVNKKPHPIQKTQEEKDQEQHDKLLDPELFVAFLIKKLKLDDEEKKRLIFLKLFRRYNQTITVEELGQTIWPPNSFMTSFKWIVRLSYLSRYLQTLNERLKNIYKVHGHILPYRMTLNPKFDSKGTIKGCQLAIPEEDAQTLEIYSIQKFNEVAANIEIRFDS